MTIKAINVRNQFKGTIKEIVHGDVLSEIDVQTASGVVTSVITTRSVKELELVVGSEVIAFVKSTEVSLAKLCTRLNARPRTVKTLRGFYHCARQVEVLMKDLSPCLQRPGIHSRRQCKSCYNGVTDVHIATHQ